MKTPEIHESVFVAPTATVVGNVRIGARTDNALFAGKARHARRIFREECKRRFKGNVVYLFQSPKFAQQRFGRCVCYADAAAVCVELGLAAACIAAHGYARGVRALLQRGVYRRRRSVFAFNGVP